MNMKKEFYNLMKEQETLALATNSENGPNVRIVNFYFDDIDKVLYFTSFAKNEKVVELEKNSRVAVTTIPKNGTAHIKIKGDAKISNKTIFELENEFSNKIEGYGDTIKQFGQFLILFEIKVIEAKVTVDFENIEMVVL